MACDFTFTLSDCKIIINCGGELYGMLNVCDTSFKKVSYNTFQFTDGNTSVTFGLDQFSSAQEALDFLCAAQAECCGTIEINPEATGIDVECMIRESDQKRVFVFICKLQDTTTGEITFTYKDSDTNTDLADLSGYIPCEETPGKSVLDSYFNTLVDSSKYLWSPSSAVDNINVVVNDPDRCNYVRVTFICPDGVLGCTLITPFSPQKSIGLPKYDEVIQVCFEVVEKSTETNIKNWAVTAPTTPIEVSVDGLDIN